jgi:GTP-binding protein
VRGELEAYGHGLAEKPEIVALSRADIAGDDQLRSAKAATTEASGRTPLVISAATGQGIEALLDACLAMLDRKEDEAPGPRRSER